MCTLRQFCEWNNGFTADWHISLSKFGELSISTFGFFDMTAFHHTSKEKVSNEWLVNLLTASIHTSLLCLYSPITLVKDVPRSMIEWSAYDNGVRQWGQCSCELVFPLSLCVCDHASSTLFLRSLQSIWSSIFCLSPTPLLSSPPLPPPPPPYVGYREETSCGVLC